MGINFIVKVFVEDMPSNFFFEKYEIIVCGKSKEQLSKKPKKIRDVWDIFVFFLVSGNVSEKKINPSLIRGFLRRLDKIPKLKILKKELLIAVIFAVVSGQTSRRKQLQLIFQSTKITIF